MTVQTWSPTINRICNADPNPEGVLNLFTNPRIAAEALAIQLQQLGFSVSAETIRTFRRRLDTPNRG